jgi:hypothetical protein
LPAAPALVKPDMQISRIRLYRIVSDTGMHRQLTTPRYKASDRRSWSAWPVSQPSTLLGALNSVIGFPQAVLLASDEGINPAGVLRSAGVTPFHRYYGPLRLPTGQDDGYWFPSSLDLSSYPDNRSPGRVSQVPCRSFDARCPVSPRGARPLHELVASRPISGFAFSGRLAAPTLCNEAEGFACATADVFAFSGSDDGVAPTAAESATW